MQTSTRSQYMEMHYYILQYIPIYFSSLKVVTLYLKLFLVIIIELDVVYTCVFKYNNSQMCFL